MNENKNESGIHMILEKSFGSGSRVEKLKGHEEHAYIYLSIYRIISRYAKAGIHLLKSLALNRIRIQRPAT